MIAAKPRRLLVGLNSTATTNNSDAATGWAQNWQGYVGQISYVGGNSQILNRAAQTGAFNNNQELVTSGSQSSSYRNPPATSIGSKSVSSLMLNAGSMYTEVFQITLVGANTLTITNTLYSGPSVYGTLISQFGSEAFGTNFLVNSFDGFAIGWREESNQPTVIDISSIQISDQISNIPSSAPRIISQPIPLAVTNGGSCTFSASVSGSPAPACQWQFNGQNVPGAIGTILNLNSVTLNKFRCLFDYCIQFVWFSYQLGALLAIFDTLCRPIECQRPTRVCRHT